MKSTEMARGKSEKKIDLLRRALALVFLGGLILRFISFGWNTRLFGDVNLFALTARRLAESGQLEYPMKYDFSPQAPYLTLNSPAGQHPPLWPLMAAGMAKALNNDQTFTWLKILSFAAGVLLSGYFFLVGWRENSSSAFIALLFVALSPWLVDYSANGSPYIAIAVLVVFGQELWRRVMALNARWVEQAGRHELSCSDTPALSDHSAIREDGENLAVMVWAGMVSGAGWLLHSILWVLPIACLGKLLLGIKAYRRDALRGLMVFGGVFLLFLVPWMLWNLKMFGRVFYSASTLYILQQLNLAEPGVFGGMVQIVPHASLGVSVLGDYLRLMAKSAYAGIRELVQMMGPFVVVLVVVGWVETCRISWANRKTLEQSARQNGLFLFQGFLSPLSLYLVMVLLWATYKLRFLIPLLPFLYWSAGVGFQKMIQGYGWQRGVGGLLLAGSLIWMLLPYLHARSGLYYGAETPQTAYLYDQMKPLAESLGKMPPGVVLGIANTLDGGIETIYWARQPFVAGRGMNEVILRKLAGDFAVTYLWVDRSQEGWVRDIFPQARVLIENAAYQLYHLKP
ncbi:MAG: hypothetical protein ACOY16_04520 [Chloroflexota bacterium]